MSDPGDSDADRLLGIELPHAFRGVDPEAVRALLGDAADALRAAQEREAELRVTVAALETELAEARADATTELATAKTRGRELVAEAQLVRRRILEDLIRRRRVLRRQIDQLRAGRERLLEAYEVVGQTVEEATAELGLALPAATAAAQRAGRGGPADDLVGEDDLHAMEAEIDAARAAGLPILDPPTPAELAAATADRAGGSEDPDELPPLVEVEPTVAAFEELRILGPVEAADEVDEVDEIEDEDEAPSEEDEAPPEEAEAAAPEADVVPLFDRLRADEAGGATPGPAPVAPAEVPEDAVADEPPPVDEPSPVVDPIEAPPPAAVEEDRAAVLADDLARRLRRALADEQNQVLDRLRQDRRGRLGADEVLTEVAPQEARVARLASLAESRLRDEDLAPDVDVAAVATTLAAEVAEGVQADLAARLVAAGEEPDDRVRAVRDAFRGWRTDRLAAPAGRAAAEALGEG